MHLNAKVFLQAYCEPETYALVHISIQEAAVFVYHRVLYLRSFMIFIVWMN